MWNRNDDEHYLIHVRYYRELELEDTTGHRVFILNTHKSRHDGAQRESSSPPSRCLTVTNRGIFH